MAALADEEPRGYVAPFDRPNLAKMKATIDDLNDKVARGEKLSREEKQTMRDIAKTATDMASAMEAQDAKTLPIAELQEELKSKNEDIETIYGGVTLMIQKESGFAELLATVARRKKGLTDDTKQSAADVNPLFAHATGIFGQFQTAFNGLNRKGVQVSPGPLKKIWRILEKTGASDNCAEVMDVVRALIVCEKCELMVAAINAIFDMGDVRVVCLWTNIDNPNRKSGSWFDVKLICSFEDDDNEHKFELQIAHKKMIIAREGLGGHDFYAETRALSAFLRNHGRGNGGGGAAAADVTPAMANQSVSGGGGGGGGGSAASTTTSAKKGGLRKVRGDFVVKFD